jgi:hypothetical protein
MAALSLSPFALVIATNRVISSNKGLTLWGFVHQHINPPRIWRLCPNLVPFVGRDFLCVAEEKGGFPVVLGELRPGDLLPRNPCVFPGVTPSPAPYAPGTHSSAGTRPSAGQPGKDRELTLTL